MSETPTRLQVYHYIRDFNIEYGYAPTYRECADGLNICAGTVFRHVHILRRMRYLQPGTRKMRCLKVKQVA